MTTPTQKGNVLENIVAAIERCVLATSPGLREDTFLIESKKIIQVGGVHHEIDILVTIKSAHGYKSVFIFECKNWMDAVGKNEVIVFSQKIEDSLAQRGYFVAKSFTRDAEAQARKCPRITLLIATEHDPAGMPVPLHFHAVNPEIERIHVEFRAQGNTGSDSTSFDTATAELKLQGSTVNLQQYVMAWVEEAQEESMRTFSSGRLSEGVYDRPVDSTRRFEEFGCLLNGISMESARLSVSLKVRLWRPAVVSHFELESRGRVLLFAPIPSVAGTMLQIGLTLAAQNTSD